RKCIRSSFLTTTVRSLTKIFIHCWPNVMCPRIRLTISPGIGRAGSLISRPWRRTSRLRLRRNSRSKSCSQPASRIRTSAPQRRADWKLWVVSAGSSWYVERVLSRAGVAATVYSNPGRLENGRGLVLEKLDPSSPYHSASVGVDKSAVVRHALRVADTVAFAGDGPTDLRPALLVRPRLRFARGFLAEALRSRGEAFQPFSRVA